MFDCNHEDTDKRLVLHACLINTNVVVVAKDTDVFVLMVYAYCIEKPSKKWFLKIGHEKYVDIRKVVDYLGEEISKNLPSIHAITGCDTTSAIFGVGKVKVLEKLKKNAGKVALLEGVGIRQEISEDNLMNAIKFVQTLLYQGKCDETLVQTEYDYTKQ